MTPPPRPFVPGRLWPLYRIDDRRFPPALVEQAADFIGKHPLMGGTTLNVRFSGTEGFSIAFTRGGLARLESSFPPLFSIFNALAPDHANAFFFNPLSIATGARVAPHIDRSLNTWTRPEYPPFPIKVSVLYLDVPEDLDGGALRLWSPAWYGYYRPVVRPSTGKLFEFRGDLKHEVEEVRAASRPRISLVLESYRLAPYQLRKIPEFFTKSSRPFNAILEESLSV